MANKKKFTLSQEHVTHINEILENFASEVDKKINSLVASNGSEVVHLADAKKGLVVELHSVQLRADQLQRIAADSFKFLEGERK